MRVRSFAQVVNLIMETECFNQTKLAKEVGVNQSCISRFRRGEQSTNFDHGVEMLSRIGWELHVSRTPKREDPVKRRNFIAGAVSATFIPTPTTTPYADTEYVRGLTARMSSSYFELGGVSSAAAALRHINCLKPALTGKDRALQSAASELARQGMMILYDAQRLEHAEYAGRMALSFAQRAGDRPAQADAYRELSVINAFQGKWQRGAMLAQNALQVPEVTAEQKAFAFKCLGRTMGMIPGHERKARHLLDQALEVDGTSPHQRADLMGGIGVALKEQRAYDHANAVLGDAVQLLTPISPLLQANYLARQVQIALCTGQPSKAAELMGSLAGVAPLVSSARLDGYMTDILTESARWANVREMREARGNLQAIMDPASKA